MDISKICDERIKKYKNHFNISDEEFQKFHTDEMIEAKTLNIMDCIKSDWVKQLENKKKIPDFCVAFVNL